MISFRELHVASCLHADKHSSAISCAYCWHGIHFPVGNAADCACLIGPSLCSREVYDCLMVAAEYHHTYTDLTVNDLHAEGGEVLGICAAPCAPARER